MIEKEPNKQQKIQKAMEQDPNLHKACRIWNPRGGEKYYREVKEAFDNIK